MDVREENTMTTRMPKNYLWDLMEQNRGCTICMMPSMLKNLNWQKIGLKNSEISTILQL
jgi:hypothetical protein